jgi:hypothetical protein
MVNQFSNYYSALGGPDHQETVKCCIDQDPLAVALIACGFVAIAAVILIPKIFDLFN